MVSGPSFGSFPWLFFFFLSSVSFHSQCLSLTALQIPHVVNSIAELSFSHTFYQLMVVMMSSRMVRGRFLKTKVKSGARDIGR